MKTFFSLFKKSKGFALLFAVLAASLLLSIALSIFNLTVKELSLSSYSRESQFSFYAADSGAECALYWDIKGNNGMTFATSSSDTSGASSIVCGDDTSGNPQTLGLSVESADSRHETNAFNMPLNDAANNGINQTYCAEVTVAKSDPTGSGLSGTTITSNGYNLCSSSGVPLWGNPNLVERTLTVTY